MITQQITHDFLWLLHNFIKLDPFSKSPSVIIFPVLIDHLYKKLIKINEDSPPHTISENPSWINLEFFLDFFVTSANLIHFLHFLKQYVLLTRLKLPTKNLIKSMKITLSTALLKKLLKNYFTFFQLYLNFLNFASFSTIPFLIFLAPVKAYVFWFLPLKI